MKIFCSFRPLSRVEVERIAAMLYEELDIQDWYGVTYSSMMNEEIILTIQ